MSAKEVNRKGIDVAPLQSAYCESYRESGGTEVTRHPTYVSSIFHIVNTLATINVYKRL